MTALARMYDIRNSEMPRVTVDQATAERRLLPVFLRASGGCHGQPV
jgi:hypothetical protein